MTANWDWIKKLQELKDTQDAFALVTVTRVSGSTPCEIGSKMVVAPNEFFGTVGGGELERQVLEKTRSGLAQNESGYFSFPLGAKTQQCCGGLVEVFIDVVRARPQLYIFGAGHVGQAMAQVLDGTLFQVHLVDSREEWTNAEELPVGVIVHSQDPLEFIAANTKTMESSYAVVLTYSHDLDFQILARLTQLPLSYLGLIGSESKWRRFRERLREDGVSQAAIDAIYCPIGVGVFGKAPKEIAVSFATQILQMEYMKNERCRDSGARSRQGFSHGGPEGSAQV